VIDTVSISADWRTRAALPGRRKLGLAPGLRVWADATGTILDRVECSLPRLLFGHNGKVIANQGQLVAALAKLHAELDRIADAPPVDRWQPWRVDMAWNFDCPARPLVLAHAGLRVPGIRSGATLHPSCNGVSWRGAASRFMVELYDKAREMRVPGSVLRAEVSLRGEQLRRRFSGDWRSFPDLYRAYREIMASIPPIQKPAAADAWPEAVGAEPAETRQRILARLAHKPPATFRRYRQRMEAAAAALPASFAWAEILPVAGPPPAVEVCPSKWQNRVCGHPGAFAGHCGGESANGEEKAP
jgi:hypothetical protein